MKERWTDLWTDEKSDGQKYGKEKEQASCEKGRQYGWTDMWIDEKIIEQKYEKKNRLLERKVDRKGDCKEDEKSGGPNF